MGTPVACESDSGPLHAPPPFRPTGFTHGSHLQILEFSNSEVRMQHTPCSFVQPHVASCRGAHWSVAQTRLDGGLFDPKGFTWWNS